MSYRLKPYQFAPHRPKDVTAGYKIGGTGIENSDQIHQHGACNPVAGLGGHQVDAIVVGGIGGGDLNKLNSVGLRVFQSIDGTVADNVAHFLANELSEYMPGHTCGGHGHSHGCSH